MSENDKIEQQMKLEEKKMKNYQINAQTSINKKRNFWFFWFSSS